MTSSTRMTFEQMLSLKADARGFSLLPRQPVHSLLAGHHASRLRGRGLIFDELRRYQPGDDVRSIDWKATARLRTPQVRVYNEERERPVLLMVDQRGSMFFGSRRTMKSVLAAEATALAGWRAFMSGDRVGGLVFNDSQMSPIRPQAGQTSLLQLFHEVARMNALLEEGPQAASPSTLNQALERTHQQAHHDHLVILISDLDGADEETRRLATLIAAHNDLLVVAIYDPLGANLRGYEGMVAQDCNDRRTTVPLSQTFRKRFQQTFQDRLDHWTELFRALKVPVLPLSTASPATEQIRQLFGAHAPANSL
jgi:uncharacterized protein (DUF58 family)